MVSSILTSIKKVLGIAESDTSFDVDVIMHINSTFSTLTQLGVGPPAGFMIEDSSAEWSEFVDEEDPQYNLVQSYTYLKVKMLFDPPATSYVLDAMNRQIQEFEVRLNMHREETAWVDPNPEVEVV